MLEYLLRFPVNFAWWYTLTKVSLMEIQDSETDNKIEYIVKFLKLIKHLKHLELRCN